jgi:glycosyltransferase involved in cell wall biosynthesis
MKIFYDYQIFSDQKYGGISRYFFELINNKRYRINSKLLILYSNNFYLNQIKKYDVKYLSKINFKGKSLIISLINKIYSIKKIKNKSADYDIFHPTYYNPYFLKYINNKPFVLTVYDMIHEKYRGTYFNDKDETIKNKKILLDKASKIIAISENTKKDIINYYNIPKNKIEVIYLANSLNPKNVILKMKTPFKYLLYVGNRSGYKNFNFFIKSVAPILSKNLKVFCAGGNEFNLQEIEFLKKLNIIDFVEQKNVNDRELVYLYKNAEVFIFPSLYEGFGIPILEAFSCGCPVILSMSSSFPEVGGGAVEYFNLNDEKSLLISIKKILNNLNYREDLIKRGYKQLKKFSWDYTVKKTKKVYEEVLRMKK